MSLLSLALGAPPFAVSQSVTVLSTADVANIPGTRLYEGNRKKRVVRFMPTKGRMHL